MQYLLISSPVDNVKLGKATGSDYYNCGLNLAPHYSADRQINVCPAATPGCIAVCLYKAGLAQIFDMINQRRITRTRLFLNDLHYFLAILCLDLAKANEYAKKNNQMLAFRLNVTSDIDWENYSLELAREQFPEIFGQAAAQMSPTGRTILEAFPRVQFYDYTKCAWRMAMANRFGNYHLTFSRSENNWDDCENFLGQGFSVAVVFRKLPLPRRFKGWRVIDGDRNDLRFLDPQGVVVGVVAKGPARNDRTGFVVD